MSRILATTETVLITGLKMELSPVLVLPLNIQTFPGQTLGREGGGNARNSGATNLLIKFSSSESQGQRYKKWRTRGLEKCSRRTYLLSIIRWTTQTFLSRLISAVESGLSDFIINYHVNSPTNFY